MVGTGALVVADVLVRNKRRCISNDLTNRITALKWIFDRGWGISLLLTSSIFPKVTNILWNITWVTFCDTSSTVSYMWNWRRGIAKCEIGDEVSQNVTVCLVLTYWHPELYQKWAKEHRNYDMVNVHAKHCDVITNPDFKRWLCVSLKQRLAKQHRDLINAHVKQRDVITHLPIILNCLGSKDMDE